jgi:uncharacterized protein
VRIEVKVHPRARRTEVRRLDEARLEIWLPDAPERDRANQRLIELIAEYAGVPKRAVTLTSGRTSRRKVFEVDVTSARASRTSPP